MMLIVEDDPLMVATLEDCVRRGFGNEIAIKSAVSLKEARERISEIGREGLLIVLLDLAIVDSSGLATFLAIRNAVSESTPIVVITGTADEAKAVEIITNGADDYIPKAGFNWQTLRQRILFAIARRSRSKLTLDIREVGDWAQQLIREMREHRETIDAACASVQSAQATMESVRAALKPEVNPCRQENPPIG